MERQGGEYEPLWNGGGPMPHAGRSLLVGRCARRLLRLAWLVGLACFLLSISFKQALRTALPPHTSPPVRLELVAPAALRQLIRPCLDPAVVQRFLEHKPLGVEVCEGVGWPVSDLSPTEVTTLLHVMSGARTYVEYGAGPLTGTLALLAQKALTVEHVRSLCESARRVPLVATNIALSRHTVRCVDLEAQSLEWGELRCSDHRSACDGHFRAYVNAIDDFGEESVDVVVVNGALRVQCALKAWEKMGAASLLVLPQGLPLVHTLVSHFSVVGVAGELVLLRKRFPPL